MNCYDRNELRGAVVVPLSTPFQKNGRPDEDGLLRLLDHVVAGGCQGALILGTTGEAASMSPADRFRLTEIACEHLKGRAGAFIGIGDNCLSTSLDYARHALKAGADAVVAHPPSYYQVGAAALKSWYLDLADQIDGPLFIYNIPTTTRHSIPLDTIEGLSRHDNIVGIKDSEGDLERLLALAERFRDRDDFTVLCGAAALATPVMKAGAVGFVPSAGNVVPALCRTLSDRIIEGNFADAEKLQARMDTVTRIYTKDAVLADTLARLKAVLSALGFGSGTMCPPLKTVNKAEADAIRHEMASLELL